MADVSKLARRALAKQPVAGPHPDAGQLTAFVERALVARERDHVLAHLATCADCREVIALAAPEFAIEEAALAPRRAWLTVPLMRWGAVGTAVAIVAVAVVLQAPRVSEMSRKEPAVQTPSDRTFSAAPSATISARQEKAPAASGEKEQPRERAALAGLRDDQRKQREDFDQKRALDPKVSGDLPAAEPAKPAPMAPSAPPPMKSRSGGEYAYGTGKSAAAPAPEVRNKVAQPAVAQSEVDTLELGAKNEAAKKDGLLAEEAKLAAKPAAEAPARSEARAADSGAVGGAATTATAARAPAYGAYGPTFTGGELSRRNAEPLRKAKAVDYQWSVSSDGRVQRSTDGRTWVYVPVAEGVKFRALAAVGEKIWAGGSGTALYHSVDAGKSWKQVKLQALTGDITHLMADRRSLIISTSAGQRMEISYDSFGEGSSAAPIQH